ncbi:hypothetical protein Baya_2222 [Bagarius yarrelli]|uniref:Uncharacterized protein n=1 Tax=Bagarius yarrelli TaxID=175774 RepID=A0A556TNF1_BAGYA|nr:hypothetical protein Baya_2222 [Bagarius yarrelli]
MLREEQPPIQGVVLTSSPHPPTDMKHLIKTSDPEWSLWRIRGGKEDSVSPLAALKGKCTQQAISSSVPRVVCKGTLTVWLIVSE